MGSVAVERAREASADGDWSAARALLERERAEAGLGPDDLDLLARSAWWLGDSAAFRDVAADVYRVRADAGDTHAAAMVALELALSWTTEGDLVIGRAWLNRARRTLRDVGECPAVGYLAYLESGLAIEVDDDDGPAARAAEMLGGLAQRLDDEAVGALALVLSGLTSLRAGRTEEGFGDLDEAMLAVISDGLPPQWAGDVHCTVVHLCHELGDLARMRAWTDALDRWASALSRTFLYVGVTRVHQLQLLAAEGSWDVVEQEVGERSRSLVGSHGWVAGEGYRELGDVLRLRGDVTGARRAYAHAADLSVSPQPGAAYLEEEAGQRAEALAGLRAAAAETTRLGRARLLLATVEIATRAGDRAQAETACAELEDTAARYPGPGLRAWAHQARACLLLADREWARALRLLEDAATTYRAQRSRYALARVHELMAQAADGLGRVDLAAVERATAAAIYDRLGAAPDVARLAPQRPPGGLTEREVEVLRCVLDGASNREVAHALVISEKTVSRHLANIYLKIGVSGRTAAAAWARRRGIEAEGPAPKGP
ncbi:LuxR C-terminal-related transcriptional regulator [uncultured Phycicoccus sp.]|uniref:LuxR C-terminal-related transcriptional regulator n=1 Tax=uncultured Phycicoccus sp. TaxID=661422 RepID=UPI0026269DEE|nr:LuxR C-terminal-related transcriptional regulator [uncultured Phycicoccus sp.]